VRASRKAAAVLLAASLSGLSVTAVQAASDSDATDPHNCSSKVQRRGDGWGEMSPVFKVGDDFFQQDVYTTIIGNYCPNGKHPNKFFPTHASHCYYWVTSKYDDPPYRKFYGTSVNPRFYEQHGGRNGNPPEYRIRDDGTRQNCSTQRFSSKRSVWLRCNEKKHDPRWKAWVRIYLKGQVVEFPMRGYEDRPYNKLQCGKMSKLGKWVKP
jgi:hypothetical protein